MKKINQINCVLCLALVLSLGAMQQNYTQKTVAENVSELPRQTISYKGLHQTIFDNTKTIVVEPTVEVVSEDEPLVTDSAEDDEPYIEESFVETCNGYLSETTIKNITTQIGTLYDIPSEILQALMFVESSNYIYATSSCNAQGLCQIMPKWHYNRMSRLGVTDLYDPYSNVLVCADILNDLRYGQYGYDWSWVLMAYNMGEHGATIRYESGEVSNYANKIITKAYELGL